jgi:hypothetical protein
MDEYYVVYAYEGGIAAVATLATLSIPDLAAGIDASVDIDTIIARLTSIRDGALTQPQVTAAINGATNLGTILTQLTSAASSATAINAKLPALESGRVPISDPVTSYSLGETLTATNGTNWTALASGAARNITVRNRTGTNIDIRKVGETTVLTMATGDDLPLPVLANSSEWEIRRTDTSNTQVTVRFLRWA